MSVYIPERENDRFTGYCSVCRQHLRAHKGSKLVCPKGKSS